MNGLYTLSGYQFGLVLAGIKGFILRTNWLVR